MPRKYKRQPGNRNYRDYSEETLKDCLDAVRNSMSKKLASSVYGIPVRTIFCKLKEAEIGITSRTAGGQTAFSLEEHLFEQHIITVSEFGFPLTSLDIRMIVSTYLQKTGQTVDKFTNNIPGDEWWYRGFLSRHPSISMRMAENIKT